MAFPPRSQPFLKPITLELPYHETRRQAITIENFLSLDGFPAETLQLAPISKFGGLKYANHTTQRHVDTCGGGGLPVSSRWVRAGQRPRAGAGEPWSEDSLRRPAGLGPRERLRRLPQEVLQKELSRFREIGVSVHLNIKIEERQKILEIFEPKRRLEKVLEHLQGEIEILEVEKKIKTRVKKQMEKTQKEYFLNEQMKAIQKDFKHSI
jgi:hypothetical protein